MARSTFVLTLTRHGTWAVRAWGRVERESIEELVEVLDTLSTYDARRQLFDLRSIETYSSEAMSALVDLYAEHPRYAATIAREVLIRPSGLVGVFAEGFFRTFDLPFPASVVTEEAQALAFLGEPPDALAIEGWEIEHGASDVVWRVRAEVVRLGAGARLLDVARELRTSERSLQRALASVGTTFREVRRDALADEIDRLRATRQMPLKEVAARLSFRSLARLSELYRSARGRASKTTS